MKTTITLRQKQREITLAKEKEGLTITLVKKGQRKDVIEIKLTKEETTDVKRFLL